MKTMFIGLCVVLLNTAVVQAQRLNLEPGLNAMARNGVPEGWTEVAWLSADGEMTVGMSQEGSFEVVLELSGLVPEGTYAVWGASRGTFSVRIRPITSNTPDAFVASAEGTALHTVNIPADNNHRFLIITYHPDGVSAGNKPGDDAFGHFIAEFPEPIN
ncbi:MAG: hypothetical protein AAF708_23200 [Deinococcota bacterium]